MKKTGSPEVYDDEAQRLQQRYKRNATWINVLRIISRVLDLLAASGSIATAGLNLAKYYQTENVVNGTQALWSPTTFTWPNYLTIASASITFVSASVVLLAYCWGRDVAERFDNRRAWIAKLLIVVQIVSAATAAIVMYKTGSSSNSLTGQTCGAPPAKAPQFPQLNFDTYCLRQNISNGLLIVHVVTGLVTLFAFIFGCLGKRDKREVERHKYNQELVTAPIGEAQRNDGLSYAEDTKYTNL